MCEISEIRKNSKISEFSKISEISEITKITEIYLVYLTHLIYYPKALTTIYTLHAPKGQAQLRNKAPLTHGHAEPQRLGAQVCCLCGGSPVSQRGCFSAAPRSPSV